MWFAPQRFPNAGSDPSRELLKELELLPVWVVENGKALSEKEMSASFPSILSYNSAIAKAAGLEEERKWQIFVSDDYQRISAKAKENMIYGDKYKLLDKPIEIIRDIEVPSNSVI